MNDKLRMAQKNWVQKNLSLSSLQRSATLRVEFPGKIEKKKNQEKNKRKKIMISRFAVNPCQYCGTKRHPTTIEHKLYKLAPCYILIVVVMV